MRISGRGRGGDSTLGDCGQGALDDGQAERGCYEGSAFSLGLNDDSFLILQSLAL